jgi:hypothetical protein
MTKNTADKKYCPKCDRWYTLDNFYTNKSAANGYAAYCKPCDIAKNRARRQKNKEGYFLAGQKQKRIRNHKITTEKFNEMLSLQEHKCAICKNEFIDTPVIDHDHSCCLGRYSCGKCTRGLLCRTCNTGLGFFKDKMDNLENAIKYLQKSLTNENL